MSKEFELKYKDNKAKIFIITIFLIIIILSSCQTTKNDSLEYIKEFIQNKGANNIT